MSLILAPRRRRITPPEMVRQAMVLAAGLGTRLRPVTLYLPKPLFPLFNRPILRRNLEMLAKDGFRKILVNAHHLASLVVQEVDAMAARWKEDGGDISLEAVVERDLLGTGGGIANVVPRLVPDSSLLVMNSDIAIRFSPAALWDLHHVIGSDATLLVHRRSGLERVHLGMGDPCRVVGFGLGGDVAFTGAYCLAPSILNALPEEPGSIIDLFQAAIEKGMTIAAVFPTDLSPDSIFMWEDIGTPAGYLAAHEAMLGMEGGYGLAIGPSLHGVEVREWAVVGQGCCFGEGVVLERAVVWDGVEVSAGEHLVDVVVTPYGRLYGGR